MTTGILALAVILVVATAIGLWYQRVNGRVRRTRSNGVTLTSESMGGQKLGERATLVQFSSSFCSPCRATRRILTEVAATVRGVTYVEVDAESNLDLVRRLDIRRTPTTLVLNDSGAIIQRASGQPRKADVVAALGQAIPESGETSRKTDPHVDPVPKAS